MGSSYVRGTLFLMVLFHSSVCLADHFDQPYFTRLAGSWTGEGEMSNPDGVSTVIHEEWTAERDGDRFLIRGTRQAGEENQEFHWIFTFNVSTELYECEYWHTGMESDLVFEVSLSDNRSQLRASLGDSGGELLITNSMEGNVIDGTVEFTSQTGESFPFASVKHTKEEE
jgi:hypothetical protein